MDENGICANCSSVVDFYRQLNKIKEPECTLAKQMYDEWKRKNEFGVGEGNGCTRSDIYVEMVNLHNSLLGANGTSELIFNEVANKYAEDPAMKQALSYVFQIHMKNNNEES